MKSIYLDYAATTPVRAEVKEAMMPYLSEIFGNASSIHQVGQRAKKALEEGREMIARCLGAQTEEIYFTSSGTESNNLAIKGIAYARKHKGRHIITTSVEHHAVLNSCHYLEERGFEVSYLPVDKFGVVSIEKLQETLRDDTILVSIMLGNNETGTLQPVSDIAQLAKERGIPLHTDAVQAIGKIPIEVAKLGVDLLSLSGHKIYGPKGIGALYLRKGIDIEPLIHGGHHEHGIRAGTENVAGIVGLAKAMELATQERPQASEHLLSLRERLEKGILKKIEQSRVNGHPQKRLPHILNVSFGTVKGETVLLALDMKGISVSMGSACASGAVEPSHVLQAMGLDVSAALSSLRFSFGKDNTEEDIDRVIHSLVEILPGRHEKKTLKDHMKKQGKMK